MEGYSYRAKSKGNIISAPKIETNQEKYLVWHIEGGLGKNIAATSLCQSIKETYPDRKLIMVVSYPEVFLNNPFIDRVYFINNRPYFYDNYIKDKDVLIFKQEPYNQTGHILKQKHLIESWCDMINKALITSKVCHWTWYKNEQFQTITEETNGEVIDFHYSEKGHADLAEWVLQELKKGKNKILYNKNSIL